MPDRPSYIVRKEPPDIWDIMGLHYLELIIAGYTFVFGILRIFEARSTWNLVLTTKAIPHLPASTISAVLVLGAVVWVFAIFRRFETVNTYYLVLRTGLSLIWLGWASFFVAAVMLKPGIVSVWIFGIFMFSAAFGLYLQSFQNEKTARKKKDLSPRR